MLRRVLRSRRRPKRVASSRPHDAMPCPAASSTRANRQVPARPHASAHTGRIVRENT